MELSVIVITYQREEILLRCLASIYAQENLPRPYEVIVIDNAGNTKIPAPDDPQIKLVVERHPENLGIVGGRRRGCEVASGRVWVFIDDDALWHDKGDIARLLEVLHNQPQAAAVAVKSLEGDSQQPVLRELPHPQKTYLLEARQPVEVPYFYGVGNALRAEAVQKVGGYRAQHFAYSMEDVGLSLRLLDAGYKIFYHPGVAVHHHHFSKGRPFEGDLYWVANSVNKTRLAWQMLPMPYPITTLLVWSLQTLRKTRRLASLMRIWRELWAVRAALRLEREPIMPQTVVYLKHIGGRLWY